VAGAEVRLSASVPGTLPSRISLTNHGSATALSLRPVKLLGPSSVFKRALDIVASALAITILFVPALILMAMIRLSSPGPALFRQRRGTVGGRRFTIYKFRTMVDIPDAGIDPTAPFYKAEDDPRITRLGAFLRRYSIDEFPQFLNVLKGDISLVGPRPLMAEQVDNLPPELVRRRGEVKAGITGWWQINGRSHVSPEEALRLDTFYIENWSFSLDLYILVKTLKTVLLRQGAY